MISFEVCHSVGSLKQKNSVLINTQEGRYLPILRISRLHISIKFGVTG